MFQLFSSRLDFSYFAGYPIPDSQIIFEFNGGGSASMFWQSHLAAQNSASISIQLRSNYVIAHEWTFVSSGTKQRQQQRFIFSDVMCGHPLPRCIKLIPSTFTHVALTRLLRTEIICSGSREPASSSTLNRGRLFVELVEVLGVASTETGFIEIQSRRAIFIKIYWPNACGFEVRE